MTNTPPDASSSRSTAEDRKPTAWPSTSLARWWRGRANAGRASRSNTWTWSVRVVDSVISELRAATGNRPLLQTNIYLSGLDLPVEVAAFATAVENEQWAVGVTGNRVVVDNDLFALLRSGTEEHDAVAVVCGTGINCIGIRADGHHARFTAWGTISGDWGGWFLGEQALWHAARAMDGRGDPTSLTESVPAHLGLPDVQAVIEAFHFGRISTDRFSTMAPLVMDAADAGDAVAGSILDRQAEEIVALAVAALKRLELLDKPVPVVLGGGVLASGNARLLGGIEAGLAERAPHSRAQLVGRVPFWAPLCWRSRRSARRQRLSTRHAPRWNTVRPSTPRRAEFLHLRGPDTCGKGCGGQRVLETGGSATVGTMRVVIAPDSFKGSLDARAVAHAIADGWRDVRPGDILTLLPQADGGEGTLDAIEAAVDGAVRHETGPVAGPDLRQTPGVWLELPGRIAVVELAHMCGLPLMDEPDPLGATTVGLGEVIRDALAHEVNAVVIGLGGSASTDGGAGALGALGLVLQDAGGLAPRPRRRQPRQCARRRPPETRATATGRSDPVDGRLRTASGSNRRRRRVRAAKGCGHHTGGAAGRRARELRRTARRRPDSARNGRGRRLRIRVLRGMGAPRSNRAPPTSPASAAFRTP